jgi:3-dehydroquinate synthase
LPERELRAGYAEVVKYGLIGDAGFFEWLESNGGNLLRGSAEAQIHAVRISCEAKANIVSADEREQGKRALLNLGHTFGHAFEAHFGYADRFLHGEGVALGGTLAFEYSARLGVCPADDASRVRMHFSKSGLPTEISSLNTDITAAAILTYMMQDKKVEQGRLTLILARAIGDAYVAKDASIADLETFLKEKTGR